MIRDIYVHVTMKYSVDTEMYPDCYDLEDIAELDQADFEDEETSFQNLVAKGQVVDVLFSPERHVCLK